MLVLVWEVTCQHEKKVMGKDLGSSPSVLQESLVDYNCVTATIRDLTHASVGHPAKLMPCCSCLAILAELVEEEENYCVAILVGNGEHIIADGVSLLVRTDSLCPYVRTLPNEPEVVESNHLVRLVGHLVDVPFNSIVGAVRPVGVATHMTCEDVLAKEVAQINIPWAIAIRDCPIDEGNISGNGSACEVWPGAVL